MQPPVAQQFSAAGLRRDCARDALGGHHDTFRNALKMLHGTLITHLITRWIDSDID